MIRASLAALCAAITLCGCASMTAETQQQNIALAVQSAQVGAILLEQSDAISPRAKAEIRAARLMAADAWDAYQAARASGLEPSTAGLTAALAALTAAAQKAGEP